MGDTANGSWGSNDLGGYLRREEARAIMDRHERAAEAAQVEHRAGDILVGLAIMGASALISLGLILWALAWAVGKIVGGT